MVIDKIENGIVLDHIKAGNAMILYRYLRLDELDCCVAIIKNVEILPLFLYTFVVSFL